MKEKWKLKYTPLIIYLNISCVLSCRHVRWLFDEYNEISQMSNGKISFQRFSDICSCLRVLNHYDAVIGAYIVHIIYTRSLFVYII